jgi:hypothetical protein
MIGTKLALSVRRGLHHHDRAGPLSASPALRRGMTERQVIMASGDRIPDSVIVRTCGNETPRPFPCKIFIYERSSLGARQASRLAVVFERANGEWRVSQWL